MAPPNKAVITLLLNLQHTFICHLITQEYFFFFYGCFQTGNMFQMKPLVTNHSSETSIEIDNLSMCHIVTEQDGISQQGSGISNIF